MNLCFLNFLKSEVSAVKAAKLIPYPWKGNFVSLDELIS